jgi:outer membrane protein assembly factor BamB
MADGGFALTGFGQLEPPADPESEPAWFLASLGAEGQLRWAHPLGRTFTLTGALLASEEIVFAGEFQGTIDLAAGTLTSHGYEDVFVSRLRTDGTPLWAKSFGSGYHDGVQGLAVDAQGNSVISGYTYREFPPPFDLGPPDAGFSGPAAFVAKLDASGKEVWTRFLVVDDELTRYAPPKVVIDGAGRVYAAGQADNPASLYIAMLRP